MNRFYVFLGLIVLLLFVYFSGARYGAERARRTMAEKNVNNQVCIIKQQEKINAETLNRDVVDIRNFLRKKYTIAE